MFALKKVAERGPERALFHFLGLAAPSVPSFRFLGETGSALRPEAMSVTNLASEALSLGRFGVFVISGR
jgi:hypothetical protein